MSDDMGTFRTTMEIENPARRGERRILEQVLVATGAELSWIPAAVLSEVGIEREKRLREPGDMAPLGARSLEGLNLRVDRILKQLVDAGPAPAAADLSD